MSVQQIADVMNRSGVKFGTSGARGLAAQLTDEVAYIYTTAFLQYLSDSGIITKRSEVCVGGDLRPSTERIISAITSAIYDFGGKAIQAGRVPSPALALFGFSRGLPTIMVTGSHIPADRNGIKFTLPEGEMMKPDEAGMKAQKVKLDSSRFNSQGMLVLSAEVTEPEKVIVADYCKRYSDVFSSKLLLGKNIGVYQHSAVGRDVIAMLLQSLGATVKPLGRSELFVPVDTEAIRQEDKALAAQWARENKFDAIVSTDGDSDRPLISDASGNWLRGDVAGILVAQYLRADAVVTPVSSNSAVEGCGHFADVARTKIGSPYVIQGMKDLLGSAKTVVGYEANGGFLLGSSAAINGRQLAALPTRDAVIVFLGILAMGVEKQMTIAELVAELPKRVTASDRLENFPTERSLEVIQPMTEAALSGNYDMIEQYLGVNQSRVVRVDATDGLRISLADNEVVHVRPSGNAPELRCYTESETADRAEELLREMLAQMRSW